MLSWFLSLALSLVHSLSLPVPPSLPPSLPLSLSLSLSLSHALSRSHSSLSLALTRWKIRLARGEVIEIGEETYDLSKPYRAECMLVGQCLCLGEGWGERETEPYRAECMLVGHMCARV